MTETLSNKVHIIRVGNYVHSIEVWSKFEYISAKRIKRLPLHLWRKVCRVILLLFPETPPHWAWGVWGISPSSLCCRSTLSVLLRLSWRHPNPFPVRHILNLTCIRRVVDPPYLLRQPCAVSTSTFTDLYRACTTAKYACGQSMPGCVAQVRV